MRNKILILTTLAMLSFSAVAIAEEDSARLKAMIGNVEYLPKGTTAWQSVSEGLKLSGGDIIKTCAGGMALITFANGSQVTLKANAEFQIESLTILAAKNASDYKLRLNTGKLRAIVENLGSDSSFSIKTPTAVTTAKGTVYYLHVQELASEKVLEKINSAGDLRGPLTVCADGGFRPPASAKAMLVTELFTEAGGVVYANPISGKYYAVNAGQESGSYENGNIDLPHDIPPDKQLEWTEGWEAILDAEGYQEPGRGLDFSINAGGAEDVENLFRQGSRTMMADYDLSANAALASKNAAAAAGRAYEASDNALRARDTVSAHNNALNTAKANMNTSYQNAAASLNNAANSRNIVSICASGAESDIITVINNDPGFSDGALGSRVDLLQGMLDEISGIVSSLDNELNITGNQLNGGGDSIVNRLNRASEDALGGAVDLAALKVRLDETAAITLIEGNDSALESLKVLIELTQAAIDRANAAALDANAAVHAAENAVLDVPGLTARVNDIIASLNGITADADNIRTRLQSMSDDAVTLKARVQLIRDAAAASEIAKAAALAADAASNNARNALDEIDGKDRLVDTTKDAMNNAYDTASRSLDTAEDLCSAAVTKANDAYDAISGAINAANTEANKTSAYIIADIPAVRTKISAYQNQLNDILCGIESLRRDLDDLSSELSSENTGSIAYRLQQSANNASLWASAASEFAGRLRPLAEAARAGGDTARIESLLVLTKLTAEAIDNANAAAITANEAAEDAKDVTAKASGLLSQAGIVTAWLNAMKTILVVLNGTQLAGAISDADGLINNGQDIASDEILADIISFEKQREKDAVRQEIHAKLLERLDLRNEIREIIEENELRRLDGYMEKISDAQAGKVMLDVRGNRVRVEQYILRPSSDTIELLNVNLRAGNDLTSMAWATSFNQSLDALPAGQLKALPWDSYLDAAYEGGRPDHIDSPSQSQGIYPMKVTITLSHKSDTFTESRKFAERSSGKQSIYDSNLLVKGFNNNMPMAYAKQSHDSQPAGTYSITDGLKNADVGGTGNNPKGFRYDYANAAGLTNNITAAFYVLSDDFGRRDDYKNLSIADISDALRVSMADGSMNIGSNNLEMVFSSSVFQYGAIDLIYVPMMKMDWKDNNHIPDYSL